MGKRACSASIRPRSVADARPVGGQPEFHPGAGQRRRHVDRVERLPGLVVVRADGIGDAPARDGQIGVELEGTLEAADRLVVVERIGPDQPAVEPDLRLRRRRVNRPVIGPEVVVRLGLAGQVGETLIEGTIIHSRCRGEDCEQTARRTPDRQRDQRAWRAVAAEVLDTAQQRDARTLRHDRGERRVEAGQQRSADRTRGRRVADTTRNRGQRHRRGRAERGCDAGDRAADGHRIEPQRPEDLPQVWPGQRAEHGVDVDRHGAGQQSRVADQRGRAQRKRSRLCAHCP